ncbi:MAG: GspH/FimT family pseudopilin [Gammaproteobacteria bacterium]|nr:GspH/FimT family pseudopilin [Gammaproteobacteria bacterium]
MKSEARFGAQMRQAERISTPFIGLYIPLIGRPRPHVGPFIGHEKPSVKNCTFSGFTLIELITTLVIAAILMTLAAPSFSNFVKNNRLTSQANELMADLAFARSEAVKAAVDVIICRSNDGATCGGTAWTDGWITGIDQNLNQLLDPGEPILRTHAALDGTNTIAEAGGVTDKIIYLRSGTTRNLVAPGEFHVSDDRGLSKGRCIQVAVTGRARISIDPVTSHPRPPTNC